jgi:O-antigen ligase
MPDANDLFYETGGVRRAVSRRLGQTAFYGSIITILLAVGPYGTVGAWHKDVLVFAISVLGVFRLLDGLIRGSFRIAEPLLLAPLLGILVLAAAQLVPSRLSGATISLDPYETRSFIMIFGSLIVCGEILFTYTDSVFRLKALVALVIFAAVGSATFGFLREQVLSTENWLLADYFSAEQGYAQFINRNHFAVMIEMAIGLIFGILMKAELSEMTRFFGWVLCGTLIYSMIAANSRGGLMSLAALAIIAVFVHLMTRRKDADRKHRDTAKHFLKRRILIASGSCVLVFALIVVMVAFVGGDAVVTRIEKVGGEVETLDTSGINRNRIWYSTVEMIKARPVFGSGLGSYEVAITEFDTSDGTYTLRQAHNDYLEVLASAGIIGFLLFTAFAAFVVVRTTKIFRLSDPFRTSCCFGAAIGLLGVLVHSLVDFGLHVPVNALLFVVLIVIATVRIRDVEVI